MILRQSLRGVKSWLPGIHQVARFSQMTDEVVFTDECDKGLIVLNRPKQLNALNFNMVQLLYKKLQEWQHEKTLIVIKGAGGKAFCAGGDVVGLAKDRTGCLGREFFRQEYKVDGLIASLKMPYVALLDGIVMGGGVGVSIHGKYRVATEKSLFAMPETLIGLFPDVGVSHFLARMNCSLGMFLALTGYRLKGYDLCHTGIATHFCSSEHVPRLEDALLAATVDNGPSVDQILQDFQTVSLKQFPNAAPPSFTLSPHLKTINQCFSKNTVEGIIGELQLEGSSFSADSVKLLRNMSPTSLKITVSQIQKASRMSVFDVLNMDYRVALRVLAGSEFAEGVRAQLIDKDKKPAWSPTELHLVNDDIIEQHFCPLEPENELNLPQSLTQ